MYKPDERHGLEPFGSSNERALKKRNKKHAMENTRSNHPFSSTAPIDRNRRTISSLDPYTPSGFIISRSSVLKSTFAMDAYAPGDSELMKRWRESCAMTTLSTVMYDQVIQRNRLDVQERALTVTVTPGFTDKV